MCDVLLGFVNSSTGAEVLDKILWVLYCAWLQKERRDFHGGPGNMTNDRLFANSGRFAVTPVL